MESPLYMRRRYRAQIMHDRQIIQQVPCINVSICISLRNASGYVIRASLVNKFTDKQNDKISGHSYKQNELDRIRQIDGGIFMRDSKDGTK